MLLKLKKVLKFNKDLPAQIIKMDKIKKKVEYFLDKYNLKSTEKPFLVAFSGGYDSMCLLNVLSELNLNLIAIHLNHNWRGKESKKEEENCKYYCDKKGIKFYSETLTEDIQKTETAAREARYKFFEKCTKLFNTDIVFTAHNANDNAETVLYRLAKGTGTKGLCGIAEKRDIFYRPLLKVKREDIENYCRKSSLTPNNDSSNSNVKYKRNLIRKEILPQLCKINSDTINAINSLSEIAQNNQIIIEEYLKTLKNPYNTKNFMEYSKAVKLELLYDLFIKNNIDYDRYKITNALEFINENQNSKSGKKLSLKNDLWLFVNNKKIELVTVTPPSDLSIEIKDCGDYTFENFIFSIKNTNKIPQTYPKDSDGIAYVDLSKYKSLTLRHRKNGDLIQPLGCKGTQKLKKYLNEKKIPQHEKDSLIFLASENEILWAPTIGISEKIKVVTTPTHVLKLINMEK